MYDVWTDGSAFMKRYRIQKAGSPAPPSSDGQRWELYGVWEEVDDEYAAEVDKFGYVTFSTNIRYEPGSVFGKS